jgi:Mycobacterial 4 TMS phage holin, superfamily IV
MDRVTRLGGPRMDTDRVIRLLIRLAIYLVSSVVGLLVADAILDDMTVEASGLVTVVVIFTIAQAILGPFIAMTVARNANAFLGGVGLVTTFVALLIASTLGDALEISGVATWIAATVLVWLVTALATLLIPLLLVKMGIEAARDRKQGARD